MLPLFEDFRPWLTFTLFYNSCHNSWFNMLIDESPINSLSPQLINPSPPMIWFFTLPQPLILLVKPFTSPLPTAISPLQIPHSPTTTLIFSAHPSHTQQSKPLNSPISQTYYHYLLTLPHFHFFSTLHSFISLSTQLSTISTQLESWLKATFHLHTYS